MKKFKKPQVFAAVVTNCIIFVVVSVMAALMFGSAARAKVEGVSNSEYRGTIYRGDTSSNKVSIMINVYWGTEHLKKMLEIFDKNDIKTTFFVGGTWVKDNAELLKSIISSGHEIGSHGYSHSEHGKLSYNANYSEIYKCHDLVKTLTGYQMELFAPPGGSYNQSTTSAATALGYKTIMWTRDTIDWRDHDAGIITNRAVVGMCGGDLILMHPTAESVLALEKIIDYAKNHGIKLTTVTDTLSLK